MLGFVSNRNKSCIQKPKSGIGINRAVDTLVYRFSMVILGEATL